MQSPWDLLKSAYKEYKNGDKKKQLLLFYVKLFSNKLSNDFLICQSLVTTKFIVHIKKKWTHG